MERCHVTEPKLRFIDCILEVAQQVADQVQSSLERGHLPLTLGGDHSFSFGSIAGAARVKKLGVIWIDAHGDFNTPDTSPSGNIHGMPLAALCGYGDDRLVHLGNGKTRSIDPANIVNVGARDLDDEERTLMHASGMTVFATEQVDRLGMYETMKQAIEIATRGTEGFYLSLDLDALDPVMHRVLAPRFPADSLIERRYSLVNSLPSRGKWWQWIWSR